MIYWRYYCVSELLMDLRLVCVIMPRSRCLLSSLWKPSVAGSPFKSSRGYGSSSLRPLRNGHDRGPPPQSQTSPTQCPPDLRPCLYLPASTPPCARMICEPELSCAGMCNGTPDKHMVMIVSFLVRGGGGHLTLNVASHCPMWMHITQACMSVWMLWCFYSLRLWVCN